VNFEKRTVPGLTTPTGSLEQQKAALFTRRLRPSKNQFFDGVTTFCLSPFGLPGGKTHRETALKGDRTAPDEPAQPEKTS